MNSPRAQDSQDWLHIALVLGSEASAQPASSVTRAQAADSAMDAMLKEFAQPGCSLSRRSSSYFSLGLMAAGMPLCDAAVPVAGALPRPARVVTSSLEMVDVPELSPASEAPEDGFFRDEPAAFESAASPRPATKRAKPMAAAEGVKVLQCELCFKTYHTAEGLRLHVRSKHENDRSCVCAQCGRGFVRSSDLRLHVLRIHETSRPHPCDHCTKSFACKSELRRHQQMHMLRTPLGYSA